jgi:hypothetical protein
VSLGPSAAVTAGALWRLDGGAWNASGITLRDIETGSHTVDFKPVTGYNPPAAREIIVSQNTSTSIVGTYVASGSLLVTIYPNPAVSSIALWRMDGGNWNSSGTTLTSVPAGTHKVEFQPVAGWVAPAAMSVSVRGGRTASIAATYLPPTGKISVIISPSTAATAGAMWRVDGGTWYRSGAVTAVPLGSHTVDFKAATGWFTPASQTVQIGSNGQSFALTGTYVKQTGSLTVAIGPDTALAAGGQWRVDGGLWNNSGVALSGIQVGTHTIELKPITGFSPPARGTVTIKLDETTSVTGLYGGWR